MSFKMRLDTREIDSWVKNQPNRDRAKRQVLTVLKNELVSETIKEIAGHTTTGELAGSVTGDATDRKLEIFSNMYGDIVLEYGRRPGKFPPVEPLKAWAVAHGMDASVGYLIARKIARSGTEKYRRQGPKQLSTIQERLRNDFIPNRMITLLNEFTK